MTRRQLVDFLRSPLAVHEEFWVGTHSHSRLNTPVSSYISLTLFVVWLFTACSTSTSLARWRQHQEFRLYPNKNFWSQPCK